MSTLARQRWLWLLGVCAFTPAGVIIGSSEIDLWRDRIARDARAQAELEARTREVERDKKRMIDACDVAGGQPVEGLELKIVCVKRDDGLASARMVKER